MTQHGHSHPHGDHHGHPPKKGGFHRDWRMWTIVLLMLAGIFVYVLTQDDSRMPWGPPKAKEPAAVAP